MTHKRYREYINTEEKWLGSHPRHWAKKPLWTLFRRVKRQGFESEELLSIYREHGVIPKSSREDNFNKPSDDLSSYQLVEPGDLAVNKMKAWQGSVAISEHRGIVSPAYHVYTPLHSENSRFLHYLMRCDRYITCYLSMSKGIRVNQWDLQPEYHSRMPVLLPPLDEQLAIASFLDRETAKIDALIAEQQRLIELLQEKRQAVISHAVTKGLNPNAPMKDSGVEWLGEVPEHWGVRRLRYIGTLQNGLNIGAEAFGEGDPFVSYGDVYNNPNIPSQPAGLVRSTPDDKRKYGLEKGDALFTRTSETVDDIGVASTCLEPVLHSTFAGFLIRLRPFQGVLEPRYSTHLFRNRGVKNHFAGTLNMVTRASLSQGELGNLPICIPPLEEQLEIAIYIEEMTEKSDHLISSARNLVSLLQERRSALISAAVTGQIDVRGLVPEDAEQ